MPYLLKNSKNYYVDIRVGSTRINKSTRTSDLEKATRLEAQWKAEAEEKWYNQQMGIQEPEKTTAEVTLSDALDHVWENRWQDRRDALKPRRKIEHIITLVGDLTIDHFEGVRGKELLLDIRKRLGSEKVTRSGANRTKATTDRYLAALRTLLNDIVNHYWPDLKLPKMPMYKEDNARSRLLFPHEEIKLFRLMDAAHPEHSMCFKVLLDTGMRVSELLKCNYQTNIRLVQREIFLDHAITKSGKERTIPLTKRAYNILKLRKKSNPIRPFEWTNSRMSQVFRDYRYKMGLGHDKEFVPHMLRHTCCTRLLEAGTDWGIVQGWMGHSTAEMTRRYAHLIATVYRPAAHQLDQLNDYIQRHTESDPNDQRIINMDDFILRKQSAQLSANYRHDSVDNADLRRNELQERDLVPQGNTLRKGK